MLDRKNILEVLHAHKSEIHKMGVKRLALFGSFARGDQSATSDLDFAVELIPKTFDRYMDLKQYLEGLFDRRIDLVLFDAIKPRLKPQILKDLVDAA